jgi:proton-dependent oligopeptide transporter, POT family
MTGLKQPKALYLLFAVKMWECFSFYGMRALMVLYLIHQLGMSDGHAYGIYAIYCSLVELGGILGGLLADRLFGLRRSIVWGGWLIAAGHICLSIQTASWAFFCGLGLIVVGSALFSTNISALLGLFYEEEDPRREGGYTLFYTGINIGALLATACCGVIGEVYGWHYGFGLAAIGMGAANLLFIGCRRLLDGKGELFRKRPPFAEKAAGYALLLLFLPISVSMIAWEEIFLQLMPGFCLAFLAYMGRKMMLSGKFSKERLALLGLYLAALALFYAAEDQTASALLMFSERFATGTIAGFPVPVTALLSLNPFVIILGGLLLSRWKIGSMMIGRLVASGMLLSAAVFAAFAIACHFPDSNGQIPSAVVAIGIAVISMGEVLLGPAIFSYYSQATPKEWMGATMGLIPIGFSLGNIISGFLSKSMASSSGAIDAYENGFFLISLLLAAMTAIVFFGSSLIDQKQKEVIL